MRVRPAIMTGMHVQSVDFFVHGSELYSIIGIFQSSASARTIDLPTSSPNSCTNDCSASTTPAVGPRRPLLVFELGPQHHFRVWWDAHRVCCFGKAFCGCVKSVELDGFITSTGQCSVYEV